MTETNNEQFIGELMKERQDDVKRSMQWLKKKIWSKSRRFVLSSQMWQHAAPTENCDVLVTLTSNLSDADQLVGWMIKEIKSKEPRLIVEARHHAVTQCYGLYLTARYENLLKGAELLHLGKRLKPQYGGGLKEFIYEDAECYANIENKELFLSGQERACVIQCFLEGIRAGANDTFGDLRFREGQAVFPALLNSGMINQTLPLHDQESLRSLGDRWYKKMFDPQPLEEIKEYFGEKIAMYFAWLQCYTLALTVPSLLGLVYWLIFQGKNSLLDDLCYVAFALLNILWATVFLEYWKRLQAAYAYRWGTLGMDEDLLAEPRPEFRGELTKSPVTGRLEPTYPGWKRRLIRYFFSFPLTLTCICLVFLTMLMVFELQELVDRYFRHQTGVLSYVSFAPKVLMAIVVYVADELYSTLAVKLNDMENYRTDQAYENNLIRKTVVFQFVTGFLALFYIAFYLQDIERLRGQLAALLITRQVIGNVTEAVIPFVMERIKLSRITYQITKSMSDDTLIRHVETICKEDQERKNESQTCSSSLSDPSLVSGETELRNRRTSRCLALPEFKQSPNRLTQAEVESLLPRYSNPLDDYLEMFIQFGFVILFSPAFPLAALCAFLNNILEIRVDAFKLCTTLQRPFGQRVQNIGGWQNTMEIMGVIGVIVNCALIAQSGLVQRFIPDLSWGGQILICVVLEHLILVLKLIISVAIPDIPQWVKIETAKMEFLRREALRKESRLTRRSQQITSGELSLSPTKRYRSFTPEPVKMK